MHPSSVPTASHKGCFPDISTEENLAQVSLALLPDRVLALEGVTLDEKLTQGQQSIA